MFKRYLFIVLLFFSSFAFAHKLAPSLLQIKEVEPSVFEFVYKYPLSGLSRGVPEIKLLSACQVIETSKTNQGSATKEMGLVKCNSGNAEAGVEIYNFVSGGNAILLELTFFEGVAERRLITQAETITFQDANTSNSRLKYVVKFIDQGFRHVLLGLDHVLFLLLLPLVFTQPRSLLIAVSLFSLGHASSVFVVAMGFIYLPVSWVEPLIALSIFALAIQVVSSRYISAAKWSSYLLLMFWGCVHGAGFASVASSWGFLAEQWQSWFYLLMFNFGVELAQVALVVLAYWVFRRANMASISISLVVGYFCGIIATVWLLQRLSF